MLTFFGNFFLGLLLTLTLTLLYLGGVSTVVSWPIGVALTGAMLVEMVPESLLGAGAVLVETVAL